MGEGGCWMSADVCRATDAREENEQDGSKRPDAGGAATAAAGALPDSY